MRISTTARLAILSALLVLASNLAVLAFVFTQTRGNAMTKLESEVTEQADALREVYRSGGQAALDRTIRDMAATDDDALVIATMNQAGRVQAGNFHGSVSLAAAKPGAFRIGAIGGIEDRDVGFVISRLGPNWLLSGRRVDDSLLLERAVQRALWVAAALAAVMGIAGGGVIAFYVGRRLRVIAGAVDTVAAGDLSHRAEVVSGGDAFDGLALRVNMMLDRIERLMEELQLLTNSLAHDLRSPLSRLRVKVERAVTLQEGPQREAALGGLIQETDIIMQMLSTLLEIGRLESMAGRSHFDWVDPTLLLGELVDMYEPVIDETGSTLDFSVMQPVLPIQAHRELLAQSLSNLIDNAIKYGGQGGVLTVRLHMDSESLCFSVEDRGPGIAPADEAEARRLFGRLDGARSRPGAGLGLALVEAVARLHGGRLDLADNDPGLAARIILPVSAGFSPSRTPPSHALAL